MTDDGVSPSNAFALLGDETRVGIVEALGEADGPLSFSELRARVGVRDSGQFNYHLSKLIGTYVRRTDGSSTNPAERTPSARRSGAGYELTYAGDRIVGAILSGTYNRRGDRDAFTLESTCVHCGGAHEAGYEDERVTVRCPTCDEALSSFGFPPDGFEGRDRSNLTRALERWVFDAVSFAADGICLNCSGVVVGHLTDEFGGLDDRPIGVRFDCQRCGETISLPVNVYLLRQPGVIAFYYDHGVDLAETVVWNLPHLREETLVVESSDPWRVRSVLELEDERLDAVIGADLAIESLERSALAAGRDP